MSVPPYIIRKLKKRQRQLRRRLIAVILIFALLLSWLWPRYFPERDDIRGVTVISDSRGTGYPTSTTLQKGTPDYTTLLPEGKSISSLGGWTRVSPPESNAVYAYADKIDGVSITVSEQPLPDDFSDNPDGQLEDLASNYSANRYITTAEGVKVYIGTSSKGPQSLIILKDDILILIKSNTALNDKQWSDYVDSLK